MYHGLKKRKYLIVRSRQTHSQRQISLTPPYPAAQSILIKKRFWLLHESELQASFLDVCVQREAAGSAADVTLSFRSSPPTLIPQTQPQALRGQLGSQEEASFLFSSQPWFAFPKQKTPRAALLHWPAQATAWPKADLSSHGSGARSCCQH